VEEGTSRRDLGRTRSRCMEVDRLRRKVLGSCRRGVETWLRGGREGEIVSSLVSLPSFQMRVLIETVSQGRETHFVTVLGPDKSEL